MELRSKSCLRDAEATTFSMFMNAFPKLSHLLGRSGRARGVARATVEAIGEINPMASYLIGGVRIMFVKDELVITTQKCMKCGALVLAPGSPPWAGLCSRCARLEAAERMSFKFD
jgi:hypothetical protein